MTKNASVWLHSGQGMRVLGRVATFSVITVVSLSLESVVMTFAAVPISLVAPQALHTYAPSLGNIIEPHEQNTLISLCPRHGLAVFIPVVDAHVRNNKRKERG